MVYIRRGRTRCLHYPLQNDYDLHDIVCFQTSLLEPTRLYWNCVQTSLVIIHLWEMPHWDRPLLRGPEVKAVVSSCKTNVTEHCYCCHCVHIECGSTHRQAAAGGETTAKVYHSVLQRIDSPPRQRCLFLQNSLGVRGSDVDIIEVCLNMYYIYSSIQY